MNFVFNHLNDKDRDAAELLAKTSQQVVAITRKLVVLAIVLVGALYIAPTPFTAFSVFLVGYAWGYPAYHERELHRKVNNMLAENKFFKTQEEFIAYFEL